MFQVIVCFVVPNRARKVTWVGKACAVWLNLPLLFDLTIVGLFLGGCLLLWLSLRVRGDDLTPTEKERRDPMVERRRGAEKEGSVLQAHNAGALIDAAPAQEPDTHAEGELSTEQNKYARSVSAAIAKSRRSSARV